MELLSRAVTAFQEIEQNLNRCFVSSHKYLRYKRGYPISCVCMDPKKLLVFLELPEDDRERKLFFRNIYHLRNIIAHKEYCKFETTYFEELLEKFEKLQDWLDKLL
jgi:hypothetical protein